MPRYFFNTHVGGDVIDDDEGEELRDADHAWEVAKEMILELLEEEGNTPELLKALIVVTDKYSHWAAHFTDMALEVTTRVDLYWDSTAAISAVLTLLTHAVAEKLGHKAEKRMDELEVIAGHLQTFRKIPKRLWPQKSERK